MSAVAARAQTNAVGIATNAISSIESSADNIVEQILHGLNVVNGLPGHAVVGLSCIIMGYTLRFIKRFPNDGIPLACILWGMAFNPMIADVRLPGTSLRIWLVRNALLGLIIGGGAWMLHKYLLSRIEDKIPGLSQKLAEADRRSDEFQVAKAVKILTINNSGTNVTAA